MTIGWVSTNIRYLEKSADVKTPRVWGGGGGARGTDRNKWNILNPCRTVSTSCWIGEKPGTGIRVPMFDREGFWFAYPPPPTTSENSDTLSCPISPSLTSSLVCVEKGGERGSRETEGFDVLKLRNLVNPRTTTKISGWMDILSA